MKITVNGKELSIVGQPTVIHELICRFAKEGDFANVTYRSPRNSDIQRSGILHKGESLDVEDGMSFECVTTSNA